MAMTQGDRSALMSRIRSKDTKPELIVRKTVHALGYRYRLHRSDLPGKPDLVFAGRKKAIFVHGCFWHSHTCGRGFIPKTNVVFWETKLERNRERDREAVQRLEAMGWSCLVIWECETAELTVLSTRIRQFLELP